MRRKQPTCVAAYGAMEGGTHFFAVLLILPPQTQISRGTR